MRTTRRPGWTGPEEVRDRLRRRWETGEFLRDLGRGQPWEPVAVPLRAPSSAELAADVGAAQDWIRQWQAADTDLIRLEWKTIGGRLIGR